MFKNYELLFHPTFGVFGMLAALWVYVEALNANKNNAARTRMLATWTAVLIWLAYITAGYFYVLHYGGDKAIIKAGPWPWAHGIFMETKEHLFFLVLLLATFLPIATSGGIDKSRAARKLTLWVSGGLVLLIIVMDGAGAIISMGVKTGLVMKLGA